MSERPDHVTVLRHEAVDALAVKAAGTYVDGTFGRGGHTREILRRLGPCGRVVAFDKDPEAVAAARAIADVRLAVVHASFAEIEERLAELSIGEVDGVLLDLGVSSAQLDRAERGFSFRKDGPLDMRMDTSRGTTAADWLATVDEKTLREVIAHYGEERFAQQIARAIVAARARGPIRTTGELAKIVAQAVRTREPGQDPATRTFQALRIYLNRELEELALALPRCVDLLRPSGRLVVISFHSLEDRIVKQFIRREAHPDFLPPRLPVRACDLPKPRLKPLGRARRPSPEEVAANPRARSAVMRVAERLAP